MPTPTILPAIDKRRQEFFTRLQEFANGRSGGEAVIDAGLAAGYAMAEIQRKLEIVVERKEQQAELRRLIAQEVTHKSQKAKLEKLRKDRDDAIATSRKKLMDKYAPKIEKIEKSMVSSNKYRIDDLRQALVDSCFDPRLNDQANRLSSGYRDAYAAGPEQHLASKTQLAEIKKEMIDSAL